MLLQAFIVTLKVQILNIVGFFFIEYTSVILMS